MYKDLQFSKWAVVFIMIQISLLSVTLVSAHGGNTDLIHACVSNSSGEIKIIGANANCPNNYRALDWNIQGPQGLQGLPGSAGISGLEVVQVNSGTQDAARIDVVAQCPAGKQVLGGGFASFGNNVDISVTTNAPDGSRWLVTLVQNDLTARPWSVQAYAICANVAP